MKFSCVSIIHENSGLGWFQEHALLMYNTVSSMGYFFLERCAHFNFIFILFCLAEL